MHKRDYDHYRQLVKTQPTISVPAGIVDEMLSYKEAEFGRMENAWRRLAEQQRHEIAGLITSLQAAHKEYNDQGRPDGACMPHLGMPSPDCPKHGKPAPLEVDEPVLQYQQDAIDHIMAGGKFKLKRGRKFGG